MVGAQSPGPVLRTDRSTIASWTGERPEFPHAGVRHYA